MRQRKEILKMKKIFFLLIFLLCLPPIFATSHLPQGLLVAQQYEQEQAEQVLLRVSFLVAFLAGILTLLSPCLLPIIPAYFSYTFKEKRQITFMTLLFFAGFTLMFVSMGIVTTVLGNASLLFFQEQYDILIQIAGIAMIFFGILALTGQGFSGFLLQRKTTHDSTGIFIYGIFFAVGWTVCVGPILAGVLSMTLVFHNYFTAALLMFFYSLGMFVPLFLFSFFYDKHHLERMSWIKGKSLSFSFLGKEYSIHTSNLVAGILFISIGLLFFFLKGTALVNGWTFFGLKEWFYILQRSLLEGGMLLNAISFVILIFVLYLIYKAVRVAKEEVAEQQDTAKQEQNIKTEELFHKKQR